MNRTMSIHWQKVQWNSLDWMDYVQEQSKAAISLQTVRYLTRSPTIFYGHEPLWSMEGVCFILEISHLTRSYVRQDNTYTVTHTSVPSQNALFRLSSSASRRSG
ncbi:hypothetical protein SCP_0203100 [Sparassis crispa]|uniref:Uncharacterized protein n=1 Tax=Sparassis crispa TaxID=139825 RepID=A0A401GAF8_9APHY|nr:hypothetical protein SCP_0203100 [Sparassis crispa]GBE79113.1 hypothetical protein SCP_0203100 [Sparassis crispa]